jgi:hypothetical protein
MITLKTAVIITKGACLTIIPLITAINSGLDGHEDAFVLGAPVWFIKLVMAALVAGAGGLLGFLSTSFSNYLLNGGAPKTDETTPTPTTP